MKGFLYGDLTEAEEKDILRIHFYDYQMKRNEHFADQES